MSQFHNKQLLFPLSGSFTGSLFGTSSYALTASYALNGGSGVGSSATASFTNQSVWTFNHNLGTRLVTIQTVDANYLEMLPQSIELTSANLATITFQVSKSGWAIATLGGAGSGGSGGTGNGFPFSGSAVITGSLRVSGSTGYSIISSTSQFTSMFEENAIDVVDTQANGFGGGIMISSTNNVALVATSINDRHAIFGDELVTIDNSGNVLIGTTSSGGNKLNVSGSSKLNGNTTITGSLKVAGGITGSLLGTASFATAASYVLQTVSASYASTASLAPNYVLTSITASMSVATASYAVTAQTASYVTSSNVVGTVISASFATTASYVLGGGGGTSAKAGSGSAASFTGTPR